MKLVEGRIEIKVANSFKPKFGWRGGRTWDYKTTIINGKKTNMHYDSTWGHNFYFEVNGKWYSIPVVDNYDIINNSHQFKLVRGGLKDESKTN